MFESIKDVGLRVVLRLVVEIIKKTNKEINIAELQKKFNAYKSKTVKFYLTDKKLNLHFRVENGKLKYVKNPKKVDNYVLLDSNTFISLLAGVTKIIDPATGKTKIVKYTPMDAWLRGDLQTYGEGSTNDSLLFFNHIFKEVQPTIMSKIGKSLIKTVMR